MPKILISPIDSRLGNILAEEIRNDFEVGVDLNEIYGIKTNSNSNLPIGSKDFINSKDESNIPTYLSFDIIIVDSEKTQLDTILLLLEYLLNSKSQKNLKFIFISSFKIFQNELYNPCVTINFENKGLLYRNMIEKYFYLNEIEQKILLLNKTQSSFQGKIIYPGIMYGLGEDKLFYFFKQALLCQTLYLFEDFDPYIPMISFQDFSKILYNLVFQNSDQVVYFAVDDAQIKFSEIIKVISKMVGTDQYEEASFLKIMFEKNYKEFLFSYQLTRNDDEITNFNWKYKNGFLENITDIVSDVQKYRGLKTIKINLFGAPISGKTYISQEIAQKFNIPIINAKIVFEWIMQQKGNLANEIKDKTEEVRLKLVDDARTEFEKKKKKAKKDVQADMIFDDSGITARIPNDYFIQCFQERLRQPDCIFRGYILEGFPRNKHDCENFYQNQEIPENIIYLDYTDELLKDNIKKFSDAQIEERFNRRFPIYKKLQNDQQLPINFFKDKEIQFKNIDSTQIQNESTVQEIIDYCKRNGEFSVLKLEQELEFEWITQKQKSKQIQEQKLIDEMLEQNQRQNNEQQQKQKEQKEKQILDNLLAKEKELLDIRSQSLRQYLIDNLMPHLLQGLIEVCKEIPQDPIQHLIDFLESKAELL